MKCVFVLLLIVVECQGSSIKIWQSNLNFDNVNNWDKKRLPCANDRIIIPENSESVFLQVNTTLHEMFLPMTGEVILGQDVVINFSSDDAIDLSCNGEDITYTRNVVENWFNPSNWQDEELTVNVETELVPCLYDQVVFSPNSVFHAELDQSIAIATMKIGFTTYTTDSLSTFFQSPSGQKQFQLENGPTVQLTQQKRCPDITGCECGNDNSVTKQKICSLYECPNIACHGSLLPSGSCCQMCGAMLSMDYDKNKFNMEIFKQDMYDEHSSIEYQGTRDRKKRDTASTPQVNLYISKVSTGQIQMVLTDDEVGTSNGQAASDRAREIYTELNSNNKYGIRNISLAATKSGTDSSTADDLGAGAVTGIVIAVLIVLVIVIILSYMFVKTRPLSNSWFNKNDDPLDASIELAPGIAVVEIMQSPDHISLGFNNPMYNSPAKENFYMDPARPFPSLDTSFSDGLPEKTDSSCATLAFSNALPDMTLDKSPIPDDAQNYTDPIPEDIGFSSMINDNGISFANPLHSVEKMENEADA